MSEFAEVEKLTYLVREKTTKTFLKDWEPYMDFLVKYGTNETVISGLKD